MNLSYECFSRYRGPYECGAVNYWTSHVVLLLFAGLFAVVLLVLAVLWLTDVNRPWRRAARAEQARQRGLAELDRRERERRRAARGAAQDEIPEALRRRTGQPW